MNVFQISRNVTPCHSQCLFVSPPFPRQVGPLLTALLLAGRIGGSYAGEIATMQATNQVGSRA